MNKRHSEMMMNITNVGASQPAAASLQDDARVLHHGEKGRGMRFSTKLSLTFALISTISIVGLCKPTPVLAVDQVIFVTSGTTWTVPSDWNSSANSIEVIGGGGGGDSANGTGSGGGGGGAYSKITNLTLTPSGSVTINIGNGGAQDVDGTATWFNGTACVGSSVCGDFGVAGLNATGGAGGLTANSVGTLLYAGGTGGTGNTTGDTGGGGGGAAGPGGAGRNGGNGDAVSASGGGGGAGGALSTAGASASGGAAGAGGNGPTGTGGGAAGSGNATAGTGGGGGGGAVTPGGLGAIYNFWVQTSDSANAGPGGGGGGAGNAGIGGAGGGYGAGGGGGEGTGGSGTPGIIVITYTPEVNVAPTITTNGGGATASTSVTENTTAVTTVTATDANVGQTLTYTISGGADAAKFSIVGATGVLTFASAPNFESATDVGGNNVYDVTVTVTDNGTGNLTDTQAIAVTVTNVNENPIITSNGGAATASVSIDENTTAVTTVTATDEDAGQTKTYSISGGVDAAKFSIVGATGVLTFVAAPDFEAPTDSGANNVYDVIVTVTDNGTGNLTDTQSIAVTVLNVVSEGPVCTPAAMSISVTPATQNVRAGFAITYTVMVTNNDSVECATLPVTLGFVDTPVTPTANFALTTLSSTSLNVAPQSSGSATLTVTAQPAGVETSTLSSQVTATAAGHANQIDTAVSTIMNYNPLIHSSKSTNSTKWGVNGWGVAGGRYGAFTCATCHVKNATPNIKRIKQTITTSPETIPGSGQTVTFTTTTDTTANFAETAGNHATSNKICEVCHTYDASKVNGSQFHGYNMSAASAADQSHYLGSDCVKCHVHKQGFKASCDTCHDNPPISAAGLVVNGSTPADATGSTTYGKHDKHVNTLLYACNTCHTGWQNTGEMPKAGNINIGFSTFGSTTGTYAGRSTGKGYTAAIGTTVTTTDVLSCTVYCHGSTIGGAVASTWLHTDTLACGDCHNTTAAVPPTLVNHPRHAGTGAGQLGLSCNLCHGTLPILGDNHLNGKVAWNITGLSGTIGRVYNSAISGETVNRAPSGSYSTCNNIYCHSNVQSTNGTAAASVYAAPTWGAASVACDSCHGQAAHTNGQPSSGSHEIHVTTRGYACSACHTGAGDETAAHANNLINVSIPATYGATAAYTQPAQAPGSGGYGTCSNVSCHNNKTTLTWGATGSCTMCHTAGGAAAADPTTGLHATTNVMAHDDQFLNTPVEIVPGTATCTSCHSTTPSTLHFDGTFQPGGGAATYNWNTTKIPLGYSRTLDDCAANCHTDSGTWNRRWSGVVNVAWAYANDATTATVCGNCHGSFATGWNIVGATSHDNPAIENDPDTLATSKLSHGECSKCHTWGHTNYSTGTKHENGTLEMNSALGYASGACSTNCHSPLTLVFADFNSGWTDATVVGDGVACGDCHNGGVTPSSTSGAHGSHGAGIAQLVAGGAACVPCHGNNGGAGFETSLAGSHGIGNAVNWATNLVYSQAATRGNIDGTCTGTAGCHVATTNIAWSNLNPTNCNQCHYNTTDTANWGWTGTAGNISMISSTEYTAVGHGQATINTAAANKACMDCHDIAIAHDTTAALTGSNPFRLKAGFTCNSIVAGCHTITGLLGTHDQATAGANYTWPFAAKCVDCHDPHGDGANLSMIHSDLADKGSAANWVRNAPDAAIEPMVFTATTGIAADSYAEPTTTFDGICQECHTLTTSMKDNLTANGANHSATSGCIGCHSHGSSSGFKASGCNSCHGNVATGQIWPMNAGADDGATTVNVGGAHQLHIQWLASKVYSQNIDTLLTDTGGISLDKQKALCQYCHDIADTDHMQNQGTNFADVFRSAPKRFQDAALETTTGGALLGTFETGGNLCSNIDCHSQYGTAAAGSEPVATPNWYVAPTHTVATSALPTTMNCSACHNNPTADTKHTVHTSATFGISITCARCHNASTAWGTPTGTLPAANHLNGTFNVDGNLTPAPAYGGTFRTSFGSCGTNYCHRSDASANTAPAQTTYVWGTTMSNCSICHLEAMATNKHSQHLASNSLPNATNVNECYVCHNLTATIAGVATGANHINGADNVNFNTTFANYEASVAAVAAGTGATTTCSNTKCHNGVTTPQWSLTVTCVSCHNTSSAGPLPSAASVIGKHSQHANNDADYSDCAYCHPNAVSYTAVGGHADHQNLTVNVTMTGITYADTANTAGGVNYATAGATHIDDGTCTNTSGCHGTTGLQGWAAASTLTNGCFACHGGGLSATETGTTKPAVDTIPNPVNNTQYTSQGHGNTTTFIGSGTTGPGSTFLYTGTPGCYNCHDSASQHAPAASATNPFRLLNANTNTLCGTCHATTQSHTKTNVGGTATWVNTYDYKCIDCHDPHGDGNYYMIRSHISAPTATNDTSFGSDTYGTPQDTANISAITFTSLAGNATNSYGVNTGTNGLCEVCHIDTAEVAYYRRNVNETNTHNTTGQCSSCHPHDTGFKPAGSCDGCHKPGGSGPTVVYPTGTGAPTGSATVYGSHLKAATADAFTTGTDWEAQCKKCHPMHAAGTNIVTIANNATMGIAYTTNGGIHLGGTSTKVSPTSEADICWTCHDGLATKVTEWGTNNGGTYNYGNVYTTSAKTTPTSKWIGTYWTSGQAAFGYKEGLLNNKPTAASPTVGTANGGSTHGVNAGAAGIDADTKIACSWCHDVHNGFTNAGTGHGKPYLRGSWISNPYPEDGAPQTTAHATSYGGVPRAGLGATGVTTPNTIGGWQIGQNNTAAYTSGKTYATFAGLCQKCHIETTLETAWASHAFVVDGFNAGGGTSIFSTTKRGGTGSAEGSATSRGHMQHNATTASPSGATDWLYGLRNADGTSKAAPWVGITPNVGPDTTPLRTAILNTWGITMDANTVDPNFHEFPCSKCHNPHASRLPKLMITNCLDVKRNAWDNAINPSTWASATHGYTAKQLAYSSTAANCHRYVSATDANRETNGSNETGWNTVTPWQ